MRHSDTGWVGSTWIWGLISWVGLPWHKSWWCLSWSESERGWICSTNEGSVVYWNSACRESSTWVGCLSGWIGCSWDQNRSLWFGCGCLPWCVSWRIGSTNKWSWRWYSSSWVGSTNVWSLVGWVGLVGPKCGLSEVRFKGLTGWISAADKWSVGPWGYSSSWIGSADKWCLSWWIGATWDQWSICKVHHNRAVRNLGCHWTETWRIGSSTWIDGWQRVSYPCWVCSTWIWSHICWVCLPWSECWNH